MTDPRRMAVAHTPHTGIGFALVMSAALLYMMGRVVWIDTREAPRLMALAERQQESFIPLASRRGIIADANGRILAGTRLRRSVFADASVIADKQTAAEQLSDILDLQQPELESDLIAAGDKRFMVLARDVSDEQAEAVKAAKIKGIGLFDDPKRVYPSHRLAAAVLGFVAADGHGVSGLEHQLEQWLGGQGGFKTVVRDAGRRAFWMGDEGYQPPRDGLNVVLTIDAIIQEQVERLLEEGAKKYDAESAVAIVMRPGNGDVLAMANYPGFDPNEYRDFAPALYRNRTVTDPVEPGSIFKPFIAAGALTERVTWLGEIINCHSGLFRDGQRLLHDHHAYSLLTFQDVMVKSSNIGMAIVGKRLGNERLHKYVSRFGFGQRTGIDLQGEDAGIVAPLHRWNSFTTTSVPMGHEVAVTPLQITRAFCAFANGGRLVTPRVVRAILDQNDNVVKDSSTPNVAPRVCSESIASTVRDKLLCEVINRGTGQNAALVGYQVFGKTGTAELARQGGGGYIPNAYISSFVGGAPARAPQLVVLVSVTKPNKAKGYYGGVVAAPIAGDILAFSLAYLGVPADQ